MTGVWRAPLRLKAKMSGTGLDAEAQGTAEPWAPEPKASVNLKVRSADLAPLLDLKPSDPLAQNIGLSSRVSLCGQQADLRRSGQRDSGLAAARPHGAGARRRKERRGRTRPRHARSRAGVCARHRRCGARRRRAARFRALERLARPHRVSGAARHASGRRRIAAGQRHPQRRRPVADLRSDHRQDRRRRGERQYRGEADRQRHCIECAGSAHWRRRRGAALSRAADAGRPRLDADDAGKPGPQRVGADGRAVRQRNGDAGIRARSPGSIRAPSKPRSAPATSDRRPTTSSCGRSSSACSSAGALSVKSAQIPFSIGDGRIRIGATTLDAEGARAIVSGGYDIPADQADIRASLASTAAGSASSRPEIQLFVAGSPDALDRTVDVAALSSWLAVRAIDRETRRLDAIERGEPPPPFSASLPPAITSPSGTPDAVLPGSADFRGADSRPRSAPGSAEGQGRHSAARCAAGSRCSNACACELPLHPFPAPRRPGVASPGVASPGRCKSNAAVAGQQAAPLPPPIEVRPAPVLRQFARPPKLPQKLPPPLVLTPQQ